MCKCKFCKMLKENGARNTPVKIQLIALEHQVMNDNVIWTRKDKHD